MKSSLVLLSIVAAGAVAFELVILCHKPEFAADNVSAPAVPAPPAGRETGPVALLPVEPAEVSDNTPEKCTLELELLGTLVNGSSSSAFIRDCRSGNRGVYRLGGVVQGAEIVKILKGEVTLSVNGRLQMLTMPSPVSRMARSSGGVFVEALSPGLMLINMGELVKEQKEILKALKDIKVSRQYENRKVSGLKIEGIREDSIITCTGIRNNDVIREVNDQKIDSYQKALQVFLKARNQPEIKVSLVREGALKQLSYRFSK